MKELIKNYCAASGLEFVEGLCDMGGVSALSMGTEATIVKDGGYRVSILLNGVEQVYGFSPINETEGLTEETKEGALRSLLYAMIVKSTH